MWCSIAPSLSRQYVYSYLFINFYWSWIVVCQRVHLWAQWERDGVSKAKKAQGLGAISGRMGSCQTVLRPSQCECFMFNVLLIFWSIVFLQYADVAQQAFSAATVPTLHNALPAIEALHASWYKRIDRVKYAPFQDALIAATTKLDEYYTKTSASDAHILAMGKYLICFGPSSRS